MPKIAAGTKDINLDTILPKLTDKQQEYLSFIVKFFQENQFYPSRREIAAHMNVTVAAVNQNITLLKKKGYLTIESGERRNIRLTANALQRLALDQKKEG